MPLLTQASSVHLARWRLSVDLLTVGLVNVQHFAAFLPFSGDCASTCPDRRREETEPGEERNMGARAKSRRGPSSPLFLHSGSGYLRRTVSGEMAPQLFEIAVSHYRVLVALCFGFCPSFLSALTFLQTVYIPEYFSTVYICL